MFDVVRWLKSAWVKTINCLSEQAAILTVVLTAVICVIYYRQAEIMEGQLKATEDAAHAAVESAHAAKSANELALNGQRAWLAPRKLIYKGKFDEPAGSNSEVTLSYENIGHDPAINMTAAYLYSRLMETGKYQDSAATEALIHQITG